MQLCHRWMCSVFLGAVVGFASLVGCNRVEERKPNYQQKEKISLKEKDLRVICHFSLPKKSMTDQIISKSLVEQVEHWALSRFQPVGSTGIGQFLIREALIAEIPSAQTLDKMEGYLDVAYLRISPDGKITPFAETRVKRSISTPVNITDSERQSLRKKLIIELVDALDDEMETALSKSLKEIF